jgi:hypothetical protein
MNYPEIYPILVAFSSQQIPVEALRLGHLGYLEDAERPVELHHPFLWQVATVESQAVVKL